MSRTEVKKIKINIGRLDELLREYYNDFKTCITTLRSNFCEEIGVNRTYITHRASSGNNIYPTYHVEKMREVLDIRIEYLTDIDDIKTEAEKVAFYSDKSKKDLDITIRYYKLLGYSVKFDITCTLYGNTFYKLYNKDLLNEYVTPHSLKDIYDTFDFSLSNNEFLKKYMLTSLKIELLKPFDDNIIDLDNIAMNTDAPTQIINNVMVADSVLKQNTSYFITAHIFKDIKEVKMSIQDFLNISQSLNNMSACFIENALSLHNTP